MPLRSTNNLRLFFRLYLRPSTNAWLLTALLHGTLVLLLMHFNNASKHRNPNDHSGTRSVPVFVSLPRELVRSELVQVPQPKVLDAKVVNSESRKPRLTPTQTLQHESKQAHQDANPTLQVDQAHVTQKTDGVTGPVEPLHEEAAPIQFNKRIISEAANAQEKLSREQSTLGYNNESKETRLAAQVRSTIKPDCLKPANSDSQNNVSNLVLAVVAMAQEKCSWK
jgi:hypothetical protein